MVKIVKASDFNTAFHNKKRCVCAALVSIVMSFTLVFGYAANNDIDIASPILYAAFFVCLAVFFFLINVLWQIIDKTNVKADRRKSGERLVVFFSSKKGFFCSMLFLALCWLPFWLAAWPGFFCYDAASAYGMYTGQCVLTNSQPILHTELLGGLITLGKNIFGSYNAGITLFFLFQIVILSVVFSSVIRFEAKSGVCASIIILSILWYAVFPTCVMHSICSTKDGLFSAAGLVFVMLTIDLFSNPQDFLNSRKKWLVIIAAVIMMLYRKNAVYAFIVFSVIVVIAIPKKKKLVVAVISAMCVLCYFSSSVLLLVACGGASASQTFDLLCVPCQQIARVYNEQGADAFEGEDKETLENMLDTKDRWKHYYETNADLIKCNINGEYCNNNKAKVAKLWFNTAKKYPKIYIEAFLYNSYQSWYPGAPVTAYQWFDEGTYADSESSYFECRVEKPGTLESKIPSLYNYLWHISRENGWKDVPVISLLYSVGFQFWVFMVLLGYIASSSKSRLAVPFLYPLLLFLTVLLGPTALVRYSLMFFWGIPLWISTVKKTKNSTDSKT